MKKRGFWMVFTALLLAAAFGALAASDGVLGGLYDAGSDLLFNTTNVTVTGSATFSFDGERFKTANVQYVQDGYNSLLDYRLLTPRAPEEDQAALGDRESGYTIIANEIADTSFLYTMHVQEPGIYHSGSDMPQKTLVRRSARLDQVAALAGIVVRQAEPLLGADAVNVTTDNHAGKTVHIVLAESDVSDLMNTAFSLGTQAVISRVIKPVDYDVLPYDNTYGAWTLSDEIAMTASGYTLKGADLTVTTDGNNRLRSVSGTVSAGVTFVNDSKEHRIDVAFEMNASDFGTSHVKTFDPDEYGVKSVWESYQNDIVLLPQE